MLGRRGTNKSSDNYSTFFRLALNSVGKSEEASAGCNVVGGEDSSDQTIIFVSENLCDRDDNEVQSRRPGQLRQQAAPGLAAP